MRHGFRAGALCALLLVSAACGGSDNDTGKAANAAPKTTGASALGPIKKATGTPITLGFVGDGKSEVVDSSPEMRAAEAAVRYVNEHLGGLGGRPIKLVTCETKQTPSGASDCATQMAEAKVPVVLNGVSGQLGPLFKGIDAAGIPFVQFAGFDQDVLASPNAFMLTNALASLVGPAAVARDAGVDRATVLVIDTPATSGPVKAAAPLFYKKAGVTPDVVGIAPGVADMTPQIQAALVKDPGMIDIIGNPGFCTSAINAIRTVGFKGTVVMIPQCLDESSASATHGGYEGAVMLSSTTDDEADPDYAVYSAAMDTYAKGVSKGGVAPGGWVTVLGFVKAMGTPTGDLTPASVAAALKAMPPTELPLGGGTMFQCDHKAVAVAPSICTTQALRATVDAKAKAHDYKVIGLQDILTLG